MAKQKAIGPASILPALERIFGEGMVQEVEGDYIICLRYEPPNEETYQNDSQRPADQNAKTGDMKPAIIHFFNQLAIDSTAINFLTPGAVTTDTFSHPHALYVIIPENILSSQRQLEFLETFEQQQFAMKSTLLADIAKSVALKNTAILASGNIPDNFILEQLNTLTKAQGITWQYDATTEQFQTTAGVNNARPLIQLLHTEFSNRDLLPHSPISGGNAPIAFSKQLCRTHLGELLDIIDTHGQTALKQLSVVTTKDGTLPGRR